MSHVGTISTSTTNLSESQRIGHEGERFVPGTLSPENAFEHLHRYELAADLARGKCVLDLASGEGYGAARLADTASEVVAVELDGSAGARAGKLYARPNLHFVQGSITELAAVPELRARDSSFDVITCFEAIEHVREHEALLTGIKRLLKPDGILLVSTPDKEQYNDIPNNHNPFHVRELYREQFLALLRLYFSNVQLYGQRVFAGSYLWVEQPAPIAPDPLASVKIAPAQYAVVQDRADQFTPVPLTERKPLYYLAIASSRPLPQLPQQSSLVNLANFPDSAARKHIDQLEQELLQTRSALAGEQRRFKSYQIETEKGLAAKQVEIVQKIALMEPIAQELNEARAQVQSQQRLLNSRFVKIALRLRALLKKS